jgi:predicted nucleic acid-binding protein
MTQVVSDASPLIVLAKAGLLDILPRLFSRVILPQAVIEEISAGPPGDPFKLALPGCSWITAVQLAPPISPLAVWQLGRGESEVIEYARLEKNLSVLIDDLSGRRAAQAVGLTVHGTVGVLGAAAANGYIDSFSFSVAQVKKAGLFISDSLVAEIEKKLERER